MSIFFDRYSALCKERGESPNSVAKKLGVSSGSITAWKRGTMPRSETVNMLASFFNVSADYLLGNVSDPFFYLDNDRIKAEINSYEDTPQIEKEPTPVSESGPLSPDDARIMDMIRQLSPENKRKFAEKLEVLIEFQAPAAEPQD